MWLTDSLLGIYVVQTSLHSLIAILIIERAIQIWQLDNPRTQFRYRIMTLVLPVSLLPFYQVINNERSFFSFRQENALLNVNQWLSLELWGLIPLSTLFMLVLAGTSFVFFLQEVLPVILDVFEQKRNGAYLNCYSDAVIDDLAREMSKKLGIAPPLVSIVEDSNPFIVTSGSKNHTVLLTSGLIDVLDKEQLKSALVHELAHIAQMSNATKWVVFLIRVLMFFNPIVLIVFRRIVQDDEHICDDITISLTGAPHVLASTLKVFYSSHSEFFPSVFVGARSLKEGVENYSHNLLLKERITRIESGKGYADRDFAWGKFMLTMGVVAVINYFVV